VGTLLESSARWHSAGFAQLTFGSHHKSSESMISSHRWSKRIISVEVNSRMDGCFIVLAYALKETWLFEEAAWIKVMDF
jgi:hypothetical protein